MSAIYRLSINYTGLKQLKVTVSIDASANGHLWLQVSSVNNRRVVCLMLCDMSPYLLCAYKGDG